MEKNNSFYDAAWHLLSASRLLSPYKKELSMDLWKEAKKLSEEIEIDEKEIGEIEKYGDILSKD
jgi:hypothetical protein